MLNQAGHGCQGSVVQTLEELARGFGLAEADTAFAIILQWYLPDLFQQSGLAVRLKEDLCLCKISEFLDGFPSADAPLSTA
jgi:hypothetical protein